MPLFTRQDRSVFYIHVPKTGGTSVEQFFLANGFQADYLDTGGPKSLNGYRRCPPQHMHAEQIMAVLRPSRCGYVFATVREPLARIVSEYKMRARGHADFPRLPAWLDQSLRRYADDPFTFENHLRPQTEFMTPGCEVFRQEDGFGTRLIERVEAVLQVTIERRQFAHHKPERQTEVTAEDREAIRARVRDVYWQDYAAYYPEARANSPA